MPHVFHPSLLRAYDMRGTYGKTIFDADGTCLGYKIASYFQLSRAEHNNFYVGLVRDGRHSSPALSQALCAALLDAGIHVIDLGVGPSPLGYFASHTLSLHGLVVITASHNPKEDNGFKILLFGKNLCGEDLYTFAHLPNASPHPTKGTYTKRNILKEYALHTCAALDHKKLLKDTFCPSYPPRKIAWDLSHGAVCILRPFIEQLIPGQHYFLCDTMDGDFPSHEPDPTDPKNMTLLRECIVKNSCDIGFAFDGDGDRLGVMDHLGTIIDGDRLVALLAQDVMNSHPGSTVIADIKSSRVFQQAIIDLGGTPLLCRSGHAFIRKKMKKSGAFLAGEMSGHIFYSDENYGYDDGLYAACRMLRLLSRTRRTLHLLNAGLANFSTTPEIKIPVEEKIKFKIIQHLQWHLKQSNIPFNEDDGVRYDAVAGWWLLRASNTQDFLILRLEGNDPPCLNRMIQHCNTLLRQALPRYYYLFEEVLAISSGPYSLVS